MYNQGMENKAFVPEILAPAGTYEAMEAAVKAGCDAIYAGGSFFSARAYAGNFDEASFLKAIDYCHLFGVKVFMTVNTLVKEAELFGADGAFALCSYIQPYYEAGLDAVLVQDVGVLQVLRQDFPDLPLHASTQMSISSACGAAFAKSCGLTRIVPARELSLEEIKAIKEQVDIEVETFVHGALCFAYSGKCLLSSFAGGRSGNRGRCAQPCRKCYETGDYKEYLLSLKDLCTLQDLPRLIDAGIDSFKIEGRMKNPSYVALAVRAYKNARDLYLHLKAEAQVDCYEALTKEAKAAYAQGIETDFLALQDIYNRGGFHGGYYFTDKGKEMAAAKRPNHQGVKIGTVTAVKPPKIALHLEQDLHIKDILELREDKSDAEKNKGIELTANLNAAKGEVVWLNAKELKRIHAGAQVWRTRNEALLASIDAQILKKEKSLLASCTITALLGAPLSITLQTTVQGVPFCATVCGDAVEAAANAPTTQAALCEKMRKTKGTCVTIGEITCHIDANAFVPMSAFNALKRQAADALKQQIIRTYGRK